MGTRALVGIDLGAGSLKVSVIDFAGQLLGSASAGIVTHAPRQGWSEQDPDDWWKALCLAVPNSLSNAGVVPDEIAAVSFSAGAHTCVLTDGDNRPLRRAILWNDQRSLAECEVLKAEAGALIEKVAGNAVSPTWTLAHLYWLKRNEPGSLADMRRVFLAKDWLRFRLTGDWSTDFVDAAGTLMFDAAANEWSSDICGLIDWPVSSLPPFGPAEGIAGTVTTNAAKDCGLPVGIPVVRGSSDTAVEAMGAGMLGPETGTIKLATAATLSCYSKAPSEDTKLISYPYLPAQSWYLITGTNSCASAHDWLRKTFFCSGGQALASFDKMDRLAAEVPSGSQGLYFHPYLNGERSPYWDPKLRADFVGMGFDHGPGHVARAFYEGIAYSLRDCLEVFRERRISFSSTRILGGGAQSAVWRQIVADTLDISIQLPAAADASFGAALLAGVGTGAFDDFDTLADVITIAERNEPIDANVRTYNRGFEIYRQIQRELAPIYHQIFDTQRV